MFVKQCRGRTLLNDHATDVFAGRRLSARAFALVLLAVLVAGNCKAQSATIPTPAEFEYTRTLWRVSDGLPEDTVQALTESRDGRMWIGTTGGLVRFDGSGMEVEPLSSAQPVSANSIFCLSLSRDGSLWAGTEGGGLLRFRDGALKVYTARDGLTDGFVRAVYEDSQSRLWVGTDGGLFVLESDRLRRVDDGRHIAPLAVHSITEDNLHRVWVGGSRLISIDRDGSAQEHTLRGAYSENRVKRIFQTADGNIWVGTVGGLQRLNNGQFEIVRGIDATVRTLMQSRDGRLWIGTIGKGLWTLGGAQNDGRLVQVSSPGLLPSDTILSLVEDDQRQIWIGTQAGLVRLVRTPIGVVTLPEGGDPDYETISGDLGGDVWVAAQSLYLIHNGVARRVLYPQLGGAPVRNVYRARDGALWIGTDGSGAFRINGKQTTHYTAPDALTNNFVRGFLEARDGSVWIATDEGVSHVATGSASKLNESNGLVYFSTRSLLEDRAGNLWIGTDHGLSCWKDGRFVENEPTRRLRDEKVWSILEDRAGTRWFGTRDHGLFRDRSGTIDQLSTGEGLSSNSIYQLLQDRSGTFWITGPNSISSISEQEMEQPEFSVDKPLSVVVYDMPFGANGAQLYGGRQPSGYLAPDNSVWFPTSRGAAHLAGAQLRSGARPQVYLGEVVEDGRVVTPPAKFAVPASVARLSLAFSAVSLLSQQGVRFRYRLDDFDGKWTAAGTSHVATYTNLSAGRYRFRVQAFDISDPAAISEVDLEFTKQPFFYQTAWFYALCFVALVVAGWSVYEFRLRQMRNRFSDVLKERNRLAREMHDTIIQGCTGVSALLEAIATTPPAIDGPKNELLDYAREQARKTIDEARQAVWDMRHERENDIDLVEALRTVAAQTTREFSTPVEFTHSADKVAISASMAHEILMTVREAVYNSVQHSGARDVHVEVRESGGDLLVAVSDRGRGFALDDSPAERGHYGIVGMRERAQRLGGKFVLTTAVGNGTRIELQVKLHGRLVEKDWAEPHG
jgi:ligand-binding sensor domain-containing protein/signal transduction histidine kinase